MSVLQGLQCAGVQELPRVQRAVRPRVALPRLQQKQVSAHPPAAAAAVAKCRVIPFYVAAHL